MSELKKGLIDNIQTQLNQKSIFIRTWRGIDIDLMTGPTKDQVNIEDIAHSLSMQCRFNGHLNRFYSVAEHSVYVAAHAPKMYAIYYLLHDAVEYMTGDFSTPVKKMIWGYDYKSNRDYQRMNKRLERGIFEALGLKYEAFLNLESSIKEVDTHVFNYEEKFLRGTNAVPVINFPEGEPLHGAVFGLTPEQAEKLFLNEFYHLMS